MKKETFTSIIAGFTERLFSKTTSIKLEFSTLKDGPGPAWHNLEIHNLVMTSSGHSKKVLHEIYSEKFATWKQRLIWPGKIRKAIIVTKNATSFAVLSTIVCLYTRPIQHENVWKKFRLANHEPTRSGQAGKLKMHNWAMAFIIILIYYYIIYII